MALETLFPARIPRTLWVELTSKCPFDCVFCSRKTRRGAGEHMPYALFESLVRQVASPRIFRLNYSGESIVYPELIPAIRLARSSGAFVELVTALASASEALVSQIAESGLNRLTVSIHATRSAQYDAIYRYGSWEALRSRLERFAAVSRKMAQPPILDFAFVAMDRNLAALEDVAALAESLDVRDIAIFPVIRRDEIPVVFPDELIPQGDHRPDFVGRVRRAVERAGTEHPRVSLSVANSAFRGGEQCLGTVPRPYPWPLPAGARIHSCEQNPWETAHVLANGDVVCCEVLDREPLGNLARQSLAEIWDGEAYRLFRQRYHAGEIAECRRCPWKSAYRPGLLEADILAARGRSAQLVHGWHDAAESEGHIWSSQEAAAVVAPRGVPCAIHVSGTLPPGPDGRSNRLTVAANGREIGEVVNAGRDHLAFGLDFPAQGDAASPWRMEFRTEYVYRPSERGAGADQRDLGFALFLLAAKVELDPGAVQRRRASLERLQSMVAAADALRGPMRAIIRPAAPRVDFDPGLSILIPERDNAVELRACLEGVQNAVSVWMRECGEPVETVVVVNGSPASDYHSLQAEFPGVRWQFHERALGFSGAVAAGLRGARFDWVYLLNNDAVLAPDALAALSPLRDVRNFAVASQIFLRDSTCFRDETNWTALLFEDGLATIHDCIPRSTGPVEGFYGGGGAALFQTWLLRRVLDTAVYNPFYWEDVEWGWRARKLGYRCIFCPASKAVHTRRATIARNYTAAEIERITERHRLLFQLRNLTDAGFVDRALDEIAKTLDCEYFLRWRTIVRIVQGRLWNYRAPYSDRQVMGLDL
jgi:radical SAM protein with 4Fe4S-binding SPASM domain